MALAGVTHGEAFSAGIWLPGRGSGRLGRFISAGSLLDHAGVPLSYQRRVIRFLYKPRLPGPSSVDGSAAYRRVET
jgi:hypothetical protein